MMDSLKVNGQDGKKGNKKAIHFTQEQLGAFGGGAVSPSYGTGGGRGTWK